MRWSRISPAESVVLGVLLLSLGLVFEGRAAGSSDPAAPTAVRPASAAHRTQQGTPTAGPARRRATLQEMPLRFEPNRGQTDPRVKFLSRGPGYTLFLTGDEALLLLQEARRESTAGGRKVETGNWKLENGKSKVVTRPSSHVTELVRLKLVGANPDVRVTGLDELPGKSNYFLGKDPSKWRTNVPQYSRVKYPHVYPGIDLVYYGSPAGGGALEYDWVVAPGADPRAITLEVETGNWKLETGRSRLETAPDGALVMHLEGGDVRFDKPLIYQPRNSASLAGNSEFTIQNSEFRDGRYLLLAGDRIGFEVLRYDRTRPLVIDPVLSYSTYLSGADPSFEEASVTINAIAVDSAGNAYVTGQTTSTDFPTTPGAFDTTCGTDGHCGGLPLPQDLITLAPPSDAFVTKFNADGSGLVYSTYLGGSLWDTASAIALDSAGNAYIVGSTNSPDFPTTSGALQRACGGDGTCNRTSQGYTSYDAFLAKLSADGSSLVYSTFLGGSSDDHGAGVALDSAGNAYIAGFTSSQNFPTTSGAFQRQFNSATCEASGRGCSYGFVAKVNPSATSLVYSTLLGGGSEMMAGIAVDAAGDAYVTGQTQSSSFPTTSGAFQPSFGGGTCMIEVMSFPCPDAFVSELNPTGSNLLYSSFLGGSDTDAANAIAVDATGNVVVAGLTKSSGFPTTPGAFQTTFNEGACFVPLGATPVCTAAFIAEFSTANSGPTSLLFSTLLGGTGGESAADVVLDATGDIYVTGYTASMDFPTLGPIQAANAGGYDAFVTELDSSGATLLFSTYLGGSGGAMASGLALDSSGDIFVAGITSGSGSPSGGGFPTTPGAFETNVFGGNVSFVSKISPTDAAQVVLSPATVAISVIAVGTTSAPQIVTLRDMGSVPVTIASMTITGGDFAQTNDCGGGVPAAGACTISVTFSPSTTGTQTGQLTINDSAPGSPHVVALSGTGGIPGVSVSSGDLGFGQVPVGTGTTLTVTLTNSGTAPLSILDTSLSGSPEFSLSSANYCPSPIPPGTSCSIVVSFTPTALGAASATLAISTNASGTPQLVALSGAGVDFSLAAASGSPTSRIITAGQTATYSLKINPSGGLTGTLNLSCGGAPTGATCTALPSSLTMDGTSAATVQVSVTTTARSIAPPRGPWGPPPLGESGYRVPLLGYLALMLALAAGLGVQELATRFRRLRAGLTFAGLLLVLLFWAACGGGSAPVQNSGTPPGTYSLTVGAAYTSGSNTLRHGIVLKLTVN